MKPIFIVIVVFLLVSILIINSHASYVEPFTDTLMSYPPTNVPKQHLSFAAFTDIHIGARYQYPWYRSADHLDKIGNDITDHTNLLDFAINLGDIANHNTAQINGHGLPILVNQYKNNLKAYHIGHINLPFHCVLGNHDIVDYEKNNDNPHNLTQSLIDETNLNNPVYAMMRDGILFLIVPELGLVQWTHPMIYVWVNYMTSHYPDTTTIILSHQAIENTTKSADDEPYRAKQDITWWEHLFQQNPQIKMWIHGHNHILDWYCDNKSTGKNHSIQHFGHTIAFSSPYAQLDLFKLHEEDRMVIYNITSTDITTAAWENNGLGGHWVPGYTHSWKINTTFDPEMRDWYSFPMFLQDNQTQFTDMKLLSPQITLQLIGTSPMELFYDANMESPPSRALSNEVILGFGNDTSGNVEWINPGMTLYGPTHITFPEKYPTKNLPHEDGRSGPLYQRFPMGTICAAIPRQTYDFTVTARSKSGQGIINLEVSCSDWSTRSQYSVLPGSTKQVFSHSFGTDYETITGTYHVPPDKNAWFLQGTMHCINATDYDVIYFSVKRTRKSNLTENFTLLLSGQWYNASGKLKQNEMKQFSVDPLTLCNQQGVINFTAFIGGNKCGMAHLVFTEPLFVCRNARFRINECSDDSCTLTLKKTISKYSTRFKLFPYSTDPVYDYIGIRATDGSGIRHDSENGNKWLSCNTLEDKEQYVTIYLHGGYITQPQEKYWYFSNKKICKTGFDYTLIIGNITINTSVYDETNVSKVEFYVDTIKQYEDTSYPYQWKWDELSISPHNLEIKTYYQNGFISTDTIDVIKLF